MSLRNTTPPESYHNKGCNCFECQDDYIQELQAKYFKPMFVDQTGRSNHAEAVSKPASYYLDSTLVARVPVTIYRTPSTTSDVVIDIPKGGNVGKIQSYVVRDGQVWWDVYWFSGKHAGWVKHEPGLFNTNIAEQTSSGVAHDATVKKSVDTANKKDIIDTTSEAVNKTVEGTGNLIGGLGDTLGSIGSNLKWILLAAVILVVVFAALKFAK